MRARIALVATLAAIVALAPATTSSATPRSSATFTFYGGGFGHGIGMSQWGAYGLAVKGWTHEQILTHYYSGTTVAKASSEPSKIRVGLVDSVVSVHLTAKNGPVALQVGSPKQGASVWATIPDGATDLLKGDNGKFHLYDGMGKRVARAIPASSPLFATYEKANAMLASPEAGHTYNRGVVEIDDAAACGGCRWTLRMIAVVSPQDYLDGLGEVSSSWPMEAMEAQVDAARTYAEFLIQGLGQHRSGCNCGVYDDPRNQVYAGWDHEGEDQGGRWVKAVDATNHEVVLYRGALIEAQYMSSSGGYTEDVQNVWGGAAVPYLRGVCDPGDYTKANPARSWKVALSADQVTSKLAPYTGNIGAVRTFTKVRRGVSGRVLSLTVVGASRSVSIAGATFRGALGLLDDRVWVNHDKLVTGKIRDLYDALDCAPGSATSGEKAVPGGSVQRFRHGAIYRNDAAKKTVWLSGPVLEEYVRVKQTAGVLGPPMSGIVTLIAPRGCSSSPCSKTRFTNGFIYASADTGAHELDGAVLKHFLAAGSAKGRLGFPTSDVTADGSGGTQASFEGNGKGAILVTCDRSGACTESPLGSSPSD